MPSIERRSHSQGRRQADSTSETLVAPRYSFMNRGLLRLDVQGHAKGFTQRFIEYPEPSPRQSQIRDFAISEGLLLGRKVGQVNEVDRYSIPGSARPISHDTTMRQGGTFSYDDANLFSDLGYMLGRLARFDPGSSHQLDGEIGENMAIVEFTRQNERKLFFVPGFELACQTSSKSSEDLLHLYVSRLSAQFDERFELNVDAFAKGFEE